jgi:outer membrane protein OmpA-like peptidoglycan-associated protein
MKNITYFTLCICMLLLGCKTQQQSKNGSIIDEPTLKKMYKELDDFDKAFNKESSLYSELSALKTTLNEIKAGVPKGEYDKMQQNQAVSDLLFKAHYNLSLIKKNATKNIKSELSDVYFTTGNANLTNNAQSAIKSMLKNGLNFAKDMGYPTKNVKIMIDIIGYASPDGSREKNLKLSQQRATSVKAFIDQEIKQVFTDTNFSYLINEPTGYGEDKDRKERVCTISFFVLPNE